MSWVMWSRFVEPVGILVKGRLVRAGRIDQLLGSAVNPVEVIASGLAGPVLEALQARVERYRAMEELHVFRAATPEAANDLVRQIQDAAARPGGVQPAERNAGRLLHARADAERQRCH